MFELVPGLAKKMPITDLKLCKVLFEDNRFYPWIFLVPKRENVKNMTYLSMEDRLQLMREMALCEKVMSELFPHNQTNVAMIGNKTPQLHIHILCRKEGDPESGTTIVSLILQARHKKWPKASKKPLKPQKMILNMGKIKPFLRNLGI